MIINPHFIIILFVFLFFVSCFGFYKLYQQVRGEDEYEKMMERADLIVQNAHHDADGIIKKAQEEADTLHTENLKKMQDLEQSINERQARVSELEHEIAILTKEDYLAIAGMRQDSVFDNLTDEDLTYQIKVLRDKESEIISVKNAVAVQNPSLDYKFVDNNIKQILRAFSMECEIIFLTMDDKTLDNVKSDIRKSYNVLNQLFQTDSVQLSEDLLNIKFQQADIMYESYVRKKAEIANMFTHTDSQDVGPIDTSELQHDDSDKLVI